MSSSYPESETRSIVGRAIAMMAMALPTCAAFAADTYVQPIVELRGEWSSNRNMDPITNSESDTYGTIADLSALIGVATPRGETSIRPRLRLQDFADRSLTEPVEGFLDIRSRYAGLRSDFDLIAKYNRRDTYTAELSDAAFDPLDPNDPTTPDTGNNQVSETRERFEIRPRYAYRVTERATVGAELIYQAMRYSGEAASQRVDYDYSQASGFVGWSTSPSRNIGVSGFVSKYEARNFRDETEAYGATVNFEQKWSETARTRVELLYERDDIVSETAPFNENVSGFGANLTSFWKGEISEWRVVAGRKFTPTGRGHKGTSDELRVQYDRQFSERFRFRGAARYLRDEALSDADSGENRDYGRLEFSLERLISPTWSVSGGYAYTYQDRESDLEAADDNRFFLAIGYRGLGRQRR